MNMKQKTVPLSIKAIVVPILLGLSMTSVWAADIGEMIEDCTHCHGKDGVSTDPQVPIIAGFSKQYMQDSMAAYVDKDRLCPEHEYPEGPNKGKKTDMCKIADDISEKDVKAIGKHFASKKFVPAKQKFDAALAAKGKEVHDELCEKCHSAGATLPSDDAGILAGQWMSYQEANYKDYAAGDRKQPKKMKQKMKKLDDEMTKQLIHYYSSQQ